MEVQDFNSKESREDGKNIQYIQKTLKYPEEDIRNCTQRSSWAHPPNPLTYPSLKGLKTVDYPQNIQDVRKEVILDTLQILATAGVVRTPEAGWDVADFVNIDVANLV